MCGIAGAITEDSRATETAVERMCRQMVPRGPDDHGLASFVTQGSFLTLGSQRLAIIDPSPAGHQPMTDASRQTTIVFNGMIYNFRELRRRLLAEGEPFTSECDTEVVLRAYGRWGAACVDMLRGMFAFAIWDARTRELFLARDRLGIKPLYYWHTKAAFAFASQVKALLTSGMVPRKLSSRGLQAFLDFGAVTDPLTAIEDVVALPAGHSATVLGDSLSLKRYWDFPEQADLGISRAEARRQLREKLEDAVATHLVSDVSTGVFLSGGVDSSVVAALAARHTRKVATVSVIFSDQRYSEAPYINEVVERIGSDHVGVSLEASDLLDGLGHAFTAMDQPSVDAVNTHVVSRAAHEAGLKVALSGLGGDELFDGYGHLRRMRILERSRLMPPFVRRAMGRVARGVMHRDRGSKTTTWLAGGSVDSPYELLRRLFLPEEVARLSGGVPITEPPLDRRCNGRDDYARLTVLELSNYTKNMLLRDTDSMSMANSLEVRVPYLDNELVEWVLRLPAATKAGHGKALMVEAAEDLLPPAVLRRKKHGFLLPLAMWTERDLRNEVEQALHELPDAVDGLLGSETVSTVWAAYRSGRVSWHRPWALYALSRWAQSLREVSSAALQRH